MAHKKNGVWYASVRWRIGDRSGRVRKLIGPRKADAIAAEAKIRASIAEGTFIPDENRQCEAPQTVSFEMFAQEEFLPWSGTEHSAEHHRRQVRIVRKHLIPYFEGQELLQVTRSQIEKYKTMRRESRYRLDHWNRSKPVQAATVNRELACMKLIFRLATEWGHLEQSPGAGVSQFKEPANRRNCWSVIRSLSLLKKYPTISRPWSAWRSTPGCDVRNCSIWNGGTLT